VPLQARV